jgi:hypothetical protein
MLKNMKLKMKFNLEILKIKEKGITKGYML